MRWIAVFLTVLCAAVTISTAHGLTDPPFELPSATDMAKIRSAIIATDHGDIVLELYPEDAPLHVANFKRLADKGFYRNNSFHLAQPGHLVQGGKPVTAEQRALTAYSIPAEFSSRHHLIGSIGMGRMPDDVNAQRRSNSSVFHILLADNPRMDGNYTVFGRVVAGRSALEKIRSGSIIRDIKVYVRE